MGEKKQLKKLASPVSWPIQRKDKKWTVKPSAGAYPAKEAIPIKVVIQDILKLADRSKEAVSILKKGMVLVDGKPAKDKKLPVGLMSIISIPKLGKHYRIFYTEKGKITLNEIKEKEASSKLCKIKNKHKIKGGKIQLTLHDGRNIIVKSNDYKTGDVLEIEVPSQKIKKHYALKKGNLALITGGKHSGEIGRIEEIQKGTINREPTVVIKTKEETLITPKRYVFVIGEEKPVISLGR